MAKGVYWERGETLDYVNSGATAIDGGTIVRLKATASAVGTIGVIGGDIPAGATGVVNVEGVYDMPKTSANAIAQGAPVYFDGSGITESDGSGSNTAAGYAAYAAAAADTSVKVKING